MEAETSTVTKPLGKYYTPKGMAQILVNWVISDRDTTVFDPCFGGCAFLYAALETLQKRGSHHPGQFLYGVDCDKDARNYLTRLFWAGAKKDHFLTTDFLTVDPTCMPGAPFDVICGNPPYVRHHLLSSRKIRSACKAMERAGYEISKRASYWAYFVLHCLNFLRVGGRLAMILPRAFVYSDYAKQLQGYLFKRFRVIRVISIDELVFKDAQEKPILFLAKGFGLRSEKLNFLRAPSLRAARDAILGDQYVENVTSKYSGELMSWNHTLVRLDVLDRYDALIKDRRTTQLKDWATIRIGVVTGANKFFIFSESSRKAVRIPREYFRPIVTRANYLKGVSFRQRDYERLLSQNKEASLLTVQSMRDAPKQVRTYLLEGKHNGVAERFKCRSRKQWYYVEDNNSQDAFLHYMCSSLPHIVLNTTNSTCSNSIHRLEWSEKVTPSIARSLALSSATSLFQLSAELYGRSLGGGVLKLEPKAAQNLLTVAQPATKEMLRAFEVVDRYLRDGDKLSAVMLADEVVLEDYLGVSREDTIKLRQAWIRLARMRDDKCQL